MLTPWVDLDRAQFCRNACAQSETGATWPQQTGQDFSTNYATPGIDFSAIHMWVDDWKEVRSDGLAARTCICAMTDSALSRW